MCETKFTKGKWRINGSYETVYMIDCFNDGNVTDIAEVVSYYGTVVRPNTEQQANAHLIAAAPEMYEILSEINYQLGSVYGDRINELLAKARGEHV